MAEQNIEPLDVQLTPLATAMLRRHLLMCAKAGLPITGDSLCKAAVREAGRLYANPSAEAEVERLRHRYIEEEVMAAGPVVSQQLLEDDEFQQQFLCDRIVSFAVIHFLNNIIKGGQADG